MDEQGWYICKFCPNAKYNFSFELVNHLKTVHGINFPLENLNLSGKEILERDKKFQKLGWKCGRCDSEKRFEHKFQFVSHWHEAHSNSEIYEACQCCCELFEMSKSLCGLGQHHMKGYSLSE